MSRAFEKILFKDKIIENKSKNSKKCHKSILSPLDFFGKQW